MVQSSQLLFLLFIRDKKQVAFVLFVFWSISEVGCAFGDFELIFDKVLKLLGKLLLECLAESENRVDLMFVCLVSMLLSFIVPDIVNTERSVINVLLDEARELLII